MTTPRDPHACWCSRPRDHKRVEPVADPLREAAKDAVDYLDLLARGARGTYTDAAIHRNALRAALAARKREEPTDD